MDIKVLQIWGGPGKRITDRYPLSVQENEKITRKVPILKSNLQ